MLIKKLSILFLTNFQGEKIKTELAALVTDLPQELSKLADLAKSLQDVVQYYTDFSSFVIKK